MTNEMKSVHVNRTASLCVAYSLGLLLLLLLIFSLKAGNAGVVVANEARVLLQGAWPEARYTHCGTRAWHYATS
jgi:hypothetical protein